MKLLELHISEFGPLKELSLKPGSGLTIICGENESGKSTIWLFIKFMLYGLSKRGSVERERAISRDGHRAAGRMLVEANGEVYQIDRSLVDSGRAAEKLTVCRVRDGEPTFVGQVPGEALLGVPKEIFENSCAIGQMMCAGISGKKEAAAIQNLLSSADETVEIDKILGKLEEIRVHYRYRRGSGGKLYELENQIHAEHQRLEGATENHLRKAQLSDKLTSNSKQLQLCERKLEEAETMEKEIAKLEVLRRFDTLRENEEKIRELRRERQALAEREIRTEHVPTAMDVTSLRLLAESLKRAETAHEKATTARRDAEAETNDGEELSVPSKLMESAGGREKILGELSSARCRTLLGRAMAIVGGLLIAVGIGLLLVLTQWTWLIACGVGSALAVTGLITSLAGAKGIKNLTEPYGVKAENLADYLRKCELALEKKRRQSEALLMRKAEETAAADQEQSVRGELGAVLSKTAPHIPHTVEAAWGEMQRLDAFLRTDSELKQQERTLTQLVENDRRILSPYHERELREGLTLSGDLSPETIARARRDRQAYAEKVRLLRNQEEQLRNELISRNAKGEDPMVIADRLSDLRAELSADTFYYEALEGALEGIRQAGETMRGNLTPVISRNAGGMMDYISDGRYGQMRVASSMNLSLVEEDRATTSADLLSGGTRDAAYISLRIALMMQIFGEELPPLMMDETLCQVDDGRMRRILSLLDKLSQKHMQCLLFTCHRRESEACGEMGIDFTEIVLESEK